MPGICSPDRARCGERHHAEDAWADPLGHGRDRAALACAVAPSKRMHTFRPLCTTHCSSLTNSRCSRASLRLYFFRFSLPLGSSSGSFLSGIGSLTGLALASVTVRWWLRRAMLLDQGHELWTALIRSGQQSRKLTPNVFRNAAVVAVSLRAFARSPCRSIAGPSHRQKNHQVAPISNGMTVPPVQPIISTLATDSLRLIAL